MVSDYEQAVSALYRAPHGSFVAERKRLAAGLKAAGDQQASARFLKLGRPSISAWAVNQLWWHARAAFAELFETAGQLRAGKLSAGAAHRKVLAKLTLLAQQLLLDAGHGRTDATLRRVSMTLAGLAAVGSFDPELPGALSRDREPPGFEAFGATSFEDRPAAPKPEPKATPLGKREQAQVKQHEAAEKERAAELHKQREARRRELETAVRDAKQSLSERAHEQRRLSQELVAAEREVERARSVLEAAEARLAAGEPSE
jgi:hypothetical protein